MKTVEATIESTGEVRSVEPVHLVSPTRGLVTILEEAPDTQDAARLGEAALAEDGRGDRVLCQTWFINKP